MHCPLVAWWYGEPNAVSNAIGYAKHCSRSHDAVIRVYDAAGKLIETYEHGADFKALVRVKYGPAKNRCNYDYSGVRLLAVAKYEGLSQGRSSGFATWAAPRLCLISGASPTPQCVLKMSPQRKQLHINHEKEIHFKIRLL
jgi:hypothetical protein